MEEYLQYMRTLRTQINEVEDHAAKISAQEQMHLTTIQNLQKDLHFVRNETKRVIEETDCIMKAKGLICSQILEKQIKIASLELDSSLLSQVGNKISEETCETEESQENLMKCLIMKFDAAKAEFNQMMQMKCNLILENSKIKQTMQLVKGKINEYEPELREMDIKLLEEEHQALLSDKAGEAEYLQSLQLQIMSIKEISHTVKCSCGEEYMVEFAS